MYRRIYNAFTVCSDDGRVKRSGSPCKFTYRKIYVKHHSRTKYVVYVNMCETSCTASYPPFEQIPYDRMTGPSKSRPEGTTGSMVDVRALLGDPSHSDGETHALGSTGSLSRAMCYW